MSKRTQRLWLLATLAILALSASAAAQDRPNILVVWGDDIGNTNISANTHGVMGYRTPNIDRIANEGMRFTDYYAEQSCTAGRSSFILGQSVFRSGLSKVGLEHTLIVLSADHGGPDTPGYSKSLGIPGGYVDPESWDRESAIARLKREFNIDGELIEKYQHPYIYLSPQITSRSDAERESIERAVAGELAQFPEVSLAISSRALEYGNVPDTELVRAVLRNFHVKRSGDVYVVFEPNWFINDFDGLLVASTHGSPWRYDSFVPVVFAGSDIRPQRIHRRIFTVDVARTLAAYLGIRPPSGATGTVLREILNK